MCLCQMCPNVPDSGSDMFPIHMSVHDVRYVYARSCRVLTRQHVSDVCQIRLDADLSCDVITCHLCKLIGVMLCPIVSNVSRVDVLNVL